MLSFKEVDPKVLGPKYQKAKVEEPKVETPDESKEDLVKELVFDDETDSSTTLFSNGEPDTKDEITAEELKEFYAIKEEKCAIHQPYLPRVLTPCPFCGGEAKVYTGVARSFHKKESQDCDLSKDTNASIKYESFTECYCIVCDTHGPKFFDRKHDGSFLFDAIDAWNRRF